MKRKVKVLLRTILVSLTLLNTWLAFAQTRSSWMQPEQVMDVLGVEEGMTIGEIGAGRGYLTFTMAGRVGNEGRVYANDIDREALKSLEEQCRNEGITNVTTIVGKVDNPLFPEGALDLAFMSFVFHMLKKPVELLKNLKPSLKPGAKLAILDFDPEKRRGPYPENAKIVELAVKAGYELNRIEKFSNRDNIWIFRQED